MYMYITKNYLNKCTNLKGGKRQKGIHVFHYLWQQYKNLKKYYFIDVWIFYISSLNKF